MIHESDLRITGQHNMKLPPGIKEKNFAFERVANFGDAKNKT